MDENKNRQYLDDLKEIRLLMEKSSRFISLSGLSGVSAGIVALAGTIAAWWHIQHKLKPMLGNYSAHSNEIIQINLLVFLLLDAGIVLFIASALAIFFSIRKSKRQNLPVWNKTAQRTLINLLIPLVTGGIFCIVLFSYHLYFLLAPSTLVFYGLALLNASKYTLAEVRYLAISEIILGLLAMMLFNYSIILWALGFGVLHIIYGTLMYYRYER